MLNEPVNYGFLKSTKSGVGLGFEIPSNLNSICHFSILARVRLFKIGCEAQGSKN